MNQTGFYRDLIERNIRYEALVVKYGSERVYEIMELIMEPFYSMSQGQVCRVVGEEHYWYFDKAFVETFINSGVDYLIWFAPCKYAEYEGEAPNLPMACIFDCNQFLYELIEYDADYMMSVES